MSCDEMELDRLGDKRTAAFFIISDTDTTYNFIVALAFSQMFNLLCERADNVHGGRLPHHVRVLWDEAANTGQVPNLEKLVAVIRSREVSLTLFYQAQSQCKAIYKDNAETIMGNMDSVVFLGGREHSTVKEISEAWLGKQTISMQTDSRSRGQSESYSQNTRGGCAANAWNFHGSLTDVYEIGCEMQKKRIECAIMIQAALAEEEITQQEE